MQKINFDADINRRGSNSYKWDGMIAKHGIEASRGIPMSVADMDFRPPDCVFHALYQRLDHGIFGYDYDDLTFRKSVQWWMHHRHQWDISADWIFTTSSLLNALSISIECYSEPGQGVVTFTPVYHAFARIIHNTGRKLVDCPLVFKNNMYELDLEAYAKTFDGSEAILLLCSPHNPGGRVWSRTELEQLADFAKEHNLTIIADEIHHDLVYSGHAHIPTATVGNEIEDRLIVLTAPSKTFNMAGQCIGNVIIPNSKLRARFSYRLAALEIAINSLGLSMATAAYSKDGADWVDQLIPYLQNNRDLLHNAFVQTGWANPMSLQATYLSWVKFNAHSEENLVNLVEGEAGIAINKGSTFGSGVDGFLRFNFAMPTYLVVEAANRIKQLSKT